MSYTESALLWMRSRLRNALHEGQRCVCDTGRNTSPTKGRSQPSLGLKSSCKQSKWPLSHPARHPLMPDRLNCGNLIKQNSFSRGGGEASHSWWWKRGTLLVCQGCRGWASRCDALWWKLCFSVRAAVVMLMRLLLSATLIIAACFLGKRHLREFLIWCRGWEGLLLSFRHLPDPCVLP